MSYKNFTIKTIMDFIARIALTVVNRYIAREQCCLWKTEDYFYMYDERWEDMGIDTSVFEEGATK